VDIAQNLIDNVILQPYNLLQLDRGLALGLIYKHWLHLFPLAYFVGLYWRTAIIVILATTDDDDRFSADHNQLNICAAFVSDGIFIN